jgi:hypothetical protein
MLKLSTNKEKLDVFGFKNITSCLPSNQTNHIEDFAGQLNIDGADDGEDGRGICNARAVLMVLCG